MNPRSQYDEPPMLIPDRVLFHAQAFASCLALSEGLSRLQVGAPSGAPTCSRLNPSCVTLGRRPG
jgi:hypothetical protein